MTTRQRLFLPGLLMTASMLLLSAFVLVWLQKSYNEQYNLLRKDADSAFRTSVRYLQDSLLRTYLPGSDSCNQQTDIVVQILDLATAPVFKVEPARKLAFPEAFSVDTAVPLLPQTRILRRSAISTLKTPDTGQPGTIREIHLIKPPPVGDFSRFDKSEVRIALRDTSRMVIRNAQGDLNVSDTIDPERLSQVYQATLDKNNVQVKFRLHRSMQGSDFTRRGGIRTAALPAGLPGLQLYQAELYDYQWYLFRQILGPLFFSLVLIALTLSAFILMYRVLRRQQELADLRSDFINNMTHELKTPIATVSVAIEALRNFNALHQPERAEEYLDISKNELQRLSLLVDKVLKISMFERRELKLQYATFDLQKLAETTLKTMSLQFEKKGADVTLEAAGTDFIMDADQMHLTSVLYNLLDNALKYGGNRPIIRLLINDMGTGVQIVLRDNGPGIPSEFQEKIFDQFFRVPSGDRHNVKGYGLGLSYVAGVMQQHGGTVRVDSEPGHGAQFTLYLPKHPTDPAQVKG